MMQDEFVRRRGWLTNDEFIGALAATNLIPGPNSTEMAIHLGYRRRGVAGGLVGGVAFILPAATLVLALSWAYFRWGTLPTMEDLFTGIQPVVVALIAFAAWRLRAPATRSPLAAAIAIAAFALTLTLPRWEVVALLAAGVVLLAARPRIGAGLAAVAPFALAVPVSASWFMVAGVSLPAMAFTFLKVGALLFGGGYVMIPLLEPDAVNAGWLTEQQFLDGLAIGQATPGPIVTTATFVGYAAAGWAGAAVATVAVFAPAFVFAMTLGYSMERLPDAPHVRAFVDGVSAAVFGAIAGVAVALALALAATPLSIVLLAASVAVLFRGLIPAYLLVGIGGGVGVAAGALGVA
jgi:chromate transporter